MKGEVVMLLRNRLALNPWVLLLLLVASWVGALYSWRYQARQRLTERIRYGGAAVVTVDTALGALNRAQDEELRSRACVHLHTLLDVYVEDLARGVLANPRLAPRNSVSALVSYQHRVVETAKAAEATGTPTVLRPIDFLVAEALGAWLSENSEVATAAQRDWSAMRLSRFDLH